MSTYFKIINLDKKQRGMLATHIGDEQAQELIAQKYDACYTKGEEHEEPYIGFSKSNIKGSWAKEHRGYLSYYSKEHAGAIFMEACGNLWGHKGEWYGDRVVIISDGPCDDKLWEESYDWPEKYFHVEHAELSWNAKDEIDAIDRKARARSISVGDSK